jgi:hypothetical protein
MIFNRSSFQFRASNSPRQSLQSLGALLFDPNKPPKIPFGRKGSAGITPSRNNVESLSHSADGSGWCASACLFVADDTFVLPAEAAEKVTVQQLEQAVAAAQAKPDKDAAQVIGGLALTERLTTARLEKLKAILPGEQSRQALLAVADASALFTLPGADIPPGVAPDAATQGHIMSLAADFVMATIPKLPNFLATRTTTRFQDMKVTYVFQEPTFEANQSFQFVDRISANLLYRDGQEVVETDRSKNARSPAPLSGRFE